MAKYTIADVFELITGASTFPVLVFYMLSIWALQTRPISSKPLELKGFMVGYNGLVAIISAWNVLLFVKFLLEKQTIFGIRESNFLSESEKEDSESFSSQATLLNVLSHPFLLYAVMKVVELIDTYIMVLRHSWRQISFLHVYHHSTMLIFGELVYRYFPWSSIGWVLLLNSIIHVCLYSYYAMAAAGYSPWWKKYLTQLQILQFVLDLVHTGAGYLFHQFCIWGFAYNLTMLGLFSWFYYQSYARAERRRKRDVREKAK